MTESFISLMVIALIAALTPIVAAIIPKQIIPETVILIASGAILGHNALSVIDAKSEAIIFLSDLGCAFLFLLAGYEINPKALTGRDGRKGFLTWIFTFIIGLIIAFIMPNIAEGRQGLIATALLFTTTALGALMPILKERALTGTRVGDLVIAYGTWGELATVLAMAVLLSTRTTWKTALILALMLLICLWIGALGNRVMRGASIFYNFLSKKADTTSQIILRLTILMLITLVAFSSIFDLDIVLGAFAAGFVLRYIIPDDNYTLEEKLNGIAYGFLVPIFFVVSGCGINLKAVSKRPMLLILFILMLFLIRTIPIVISLSLDKNPDTRINIHHRFSVGFYCTTALPLIVAITTIAVKYEFMNTEIASVLIAAGALSVFIMPFLGSITYRVVDADPINAVVEIIHSPKEINKIIKSHIDREHELAREYMDIAENRIKERLESIKNPYEKARMEELLKKQRRENKRFEKNQINERKKLLDKQNDEIKEIYCDFHDDESVCKIDIDDKDKKDAQNKKR